MNGYLPLIFIVKGMLENVLCFRYALYKQIYFVSDMFTMTLRKETQDFWINKKNTSL